MAKSIKGTKTEKKFIGIICRWVTGKKSLHLLCQRGKKRRFLSRLPIFFLETAENEKEHAKIYFKPWGGDVEITAAYPAGVIGDTKGNLEAAAAGENMEWTTLYANFAKFAREEGFLEVAISFEQISKVEKFHESRYRKLIANIAGKEVFKKENNCEVALY